MTVLTPLSELVRDHNYDLGQAQTSLIGLPAYGAGGEQVGSVRDAMTENGGTIRYLLVEAGSWFTRKEVLVPVGLARIEDDAVYFDTLTKDQVRDLQAYSAGEMHSDEAQVSDLRVLKGTDYQAPATTGVAARAADHYQDQSLFRTPDRLQLLEERLQVNKDRYRAGSVEVGKHVETRTENVNVNLSHDEVVIERHPVSDPRPVDGNVTLGSDSETIRVDLGAGRA
ncbi:PRC and DUF2382 domain-containing protein, partial [Deinococcus sonorensis]